MKEHRLAKVASELNRSIKILAETLQSYGFKVVPKPTTKITEMMYHLLLHNFSADKSEKEEASKLKSFGHKKQAALTTNSNMPKAPDLLDEEKKFENATPISEVLSAPKILVKTDNRVKEQTKNTVIDSSATQKVRKSLFPILKFEEIGSTHYKKEVKQDNIEDEEFEELVSEVMNQGFTMSEQVSNYIVRKKLGNKYKHISGVLDMENDLSSWKFNGGFPPSIYAKLCKRLNLENKGTDSRVVKFTPFKDLSKK